nr:MAG TPA: hypothetical protein [Caudoviricetes sp.]
MIRMDKVQSGILRYIDNEVVSQMSGVNKWLVAAAAAAYVVEAPRLVKKLKENKFFAELNLVDEAGNVDVEKIYQYIKPAAEKGPAPLALPIIGTLTFTAADVDSLYSYIMQA